MSLTNIDIQSTNNDSKLISESFKRLELKVDNLVYETSRKLDETSRKLEETNHLVTDANKSIGIVFNLLLDPWETIHTERTESRNQASELFLEQVSTYYGTVQKYYCMILGSNINRCDIICSHIWPKHTYGQGLETFELNASDVNNSRNFLRLHKDIEKAFDKKWLYFDYHHLTETSFKLIVRVVNPILLDDTNDKSKIKNNQGVTIKTFSDINDSHTDYTFTNEMKPFKRLLAAHANRTINNAKGFNWITDEAFFSERLDRIIGLARMSLEGKPAMKTIFFR